MTIAYFLTAIAPIAAIFILLVVMRLPARIAMPAGLVLTVVLAAWVWQMPPVRIGAAVIEGLYAAFSILWIVLGAILLLRTLAACGALDRIRSGFMHISPDRRIQLIIIAWLFGAFIEGAAGFGTPAILCAPLLIALGFPALPAVVLALAANSTPVSYGAVGTPVLIGMRMGLESGGQPADIVAAALDVPLEAYLQTISVQAMMMELSVGVFVPLLLCVLMTGFFGRNRSWREGLSIWRFALFSGFAFIVPAFLVAYVLGPEFPSMIGGLVGLTVVIFAVRRGFLVPKSSWDDFAPGLDDGLFPVHETHKGVSASPPENTGAIPLWFAWLPYILIALLLILTRLHDLPLRAWLQSVAIIWPDIGGTDISARIEPLYLPGTVFVLVVLVTALLYRMRLRALAGVAGESLRTLIPSAIALCGAVPLVRIFVHSDVNDSNLASMPLELAALASSVTGAAWPFFAPFLGVLGAFISGSATFSNMMFSLLQFSAAQDAGLVPHIVLAAQLMGANAGNMIAVMNVVAVASIAGLSGREGQIIRYTLVPMLLICTLAGVSAWLWTMMLMTAI